MSPKEQENPDMPQWTEAFHEKTAMPTGLDRDVYDTVQAYADAQAAAPDNHALLQTWISAYPQFQDELRVVSWQIWTQGPDWPRADEAVSPEEDPELVAAGRSVLASLFPQETFALPLTSLLAAAKAKGLDPHDLAQALHLDIALLARLEQRLIRVASLPRRLVEQIAQTLDRSPADVTAFLRGKPSFAASAHYKARQAPSISSQTDFAAVLTSSSADARRAWQEDQDILGETEETSKEEAL